jgi:hypothetical protein
MTSPPWLTLGGLFYTMRLLAGFFCLLFATGCLNTRDVEPPVSGTTDWVSPTDYEILLSNLSLAINQRNSQNFLRCLDADSLRFVPATVTYTGNQSIWDNWAWQDEQAWFSNCVNSLGIPTGNYLELHEVDLQSFSTDSIRYIGDYELVMNHTDTALTVTFKGQLELVMKVNEFNEWQIATWKDYETHPDSSWSRLKLSYVQ